MAFDEQLILAAFGKMKSNPPTNKIPYPQPLINFNFIHPSWVLAPFHNESNKPCVHDTNSFPQLTLPTPMMHGRSTLPCTFCATSWPPFGKKKNATHRLEDHKIRTNWNSSLPSDLFEVLYSVEAVWPSCGYQSSTSQKTKGGRTHNLWARPWSLQNVSSVP